MATLAGALKDEIRRLARKEIKAEKALDALGKLFASNFGLSEQPACGVQGTWCQRNWDRD